MGYNLNEFLKGPTAVAFSYEDPVAPAKVLVDFAKTHKQLEIKAGVIEAKSPIKMLLENWQRCLRKNSY